MIEAKRKREKATQRGGVRESSQGEERSFMVGAQRIKKRKKKEPSVGGAGDQRGGTMRREVLGIRRLLPVPGGTEKNSAREEVLSSGYPI